VKHPTAAEVDLVALGDNLRAIQSLLRTRGPESFSADSGAKETPDPFVIAVVKANAYGHGAAPAGRALEAAGASMLACADIEEGIELRESGIGIPILVFGALGVSDLGGIFTHRLTPTVSTPSAGRALQHAAAARGVTLRCHLKIDTGMNRLGFRFDNLARTMPEVAAHPNLAFDAVYTHFATADNPDDPFYDVQRVRFDEAVRALDAVGLGPLPRHAANSAALLRDERVWYDAVRPGLLLYGVVPPPLASTVPLRPVLTLRSRLVAVKGLRPGEGVGYGHTYVVREPRQIGIVPAGYADGLDRRLAGRGSVLVRGRRVPIVGAVSMDSLTIDLTGLDAAPGDEVVLLGEQDGALIDAREMAAAIGTIPYEVLCRLGSRIKRVYTEAGD
jgi:alanine racemase